MSIIKSYLIPGLPHLLLQPDKKPQWKKLRDALDKVRTEIEDINPDLIMIYSTYWSSIIGHQIQAREHIKWTLVDEEWHSLGSIKYEMKSDVEFAHRLSQNSTEKGLLTKLTDYNGFPIDTGTVVANSILNPLNKFKTCVVSANIYSDRQETQVLGKAVRKTIFESKKRVVVLVISSLSNRYRLEPLDDSDDKISSLKDNEWNLKLLEFLNQGRLEDVSQLSRQFHREARVTRKVVNFKPFWWWSAVTGQNNNYVGEVYEYQPVHGTGAAVVGMTASDKSFGDLEFDEEDSDFYSGNRNVLNTSTIPNPKNTNMVIPETNSNHSSDNGDDNGF